METRAPSIPKLQWKLSPDPPAWSLIFRIRVIPVGSPFLGELADVLVLAPPISPTK